MSSASRFITMVVHGLRSSILRYLAWRTRRATRAILHGLEDRTLHDIGLNRSEIEAVTGALETALWWRYRVVRRMTLGCTN